MCALHDVPFGIPELARRPQGHHVIILKIHSVSLHAWSCPGAMHVLPCLQRCSNTCLQAQFPLHPFASYSSTRLSPKPCGTCTYHTAVIFTHTGLTAVVLGRQVAPRSRIPQGSLCFNKNSRDRRSCWCIPGPNRLSPPLSRFGLV